MHSPEDKVRCAHYRNRHGLNRQKQPVPKVVGTKCNILRPNSANKNKRHFWHETGYEACANESSFIKILNGIAVCGENNDAIPRLSQKQEQLPSSVNSPKQRNSRLHSDIHHREDAIKSPKHELQRWKHKHEDTHKELIETQETADELEEENEALKRDVLELETELKDSKYDYEKLVHTFKRLKTNEQEYKKKLEICHEQLSEVFNYSQCLAKENDKLKLEVMKLQIRSEECHSKTFYETQIANIQREKLELEESKANLELRYDRMKRDFQQQLHRKDNELENNKTRNNDEKINTLETDKTNLISEYDKKVSKFQQTISDLKRRGDELLTENDELKKNLKQSSNDRNILEQRLQSTETNLKDERKRLREISEEKTSKHDENSELRTSFAAVQRKIEHAEADIHRLEKEKSNLLSEYETETSEFKQNTHDLERLVNYLSKENENMKDISKQNETLTNDNDTLKQRVQRTELELLATKKKLQKEDLNSKAVNESKLSNLQQEKHTLEVCNSDLERQNRQMNKDIAEMKVRLERNFDDLQKQLYHTEKKLKDTESELENTKSILQNISKDIASKNNENAELRERLEIYMQTSRNTDKKVKTLETEKENLISQYDKEVTKLQHITSDLKRRGDELSIENEGLKKNLKRSSNDMDVLKQRLQSTETNITDERKRLREISEEKTSKHEENSELRNKLAALQRKSEDSEADIHSLEKEKSNLISEYETKISVFTQRTHDLERRVNYLSKENENMKDISKQNETLTNDYDTLKKRVQLTELELMETKTKLQKEELNSKALNESKVSNLQQEKHKLEVCNADLERQNQQMNKDIAEMKIRLESNCDDLQKQLYHTEEKLKDTESELENTKSRLRHITDEDARKNTKIMELRNRLADLEKNFQHASMNADKNIKSLESANSRLMSDSKDMKKRIEDLVTENDKLKKQCKQNEKQSSNDAYSLQQRLQSTEMQLTDARKTLNQEKQNANMYESKITNLQQEKRKLGDCKRDLEAKNDEMKKELIKLKNTPESTQTARHLDSDYDAMQRRLRRKEEELKAVELELEDTKTRLSKCMGDKLTNNNPNIVDLSDMNRPSKLADRYKELYDNQWTDAYEILEKSEATEEQIILVLLNVLIETKRFCDEHTQREMRQILEAITHNDKVKLADVPVGVIKYIKDCRKSSAAETIKIKFKEYKAGLRSGSFHFAKQALTINEFLHECFDICWLMAIQDPPVVLGSLLNHGERFKTDLYSAYTVSGKIVDYVVWPALLLHDNGPTLTKGVAQGMKNA